MRPLLTSLLVFSVLAAPAAARIEPPTDLHYPLGQDLRSPDARDAADAGHAQAQQDLARLQAGLPRLRAQEQHYSSYGKATPVRDTVRTSAHHDGSPVPTLAIGLGLIVLVAGAIAFAVRTRRRTMRVAV
jgi:RecB family exonuclease